MYVQTSAITLNIHRNKKKLSQRWNNFYEIEMQRDMYSIYLIMSSAKLSAVKVFMKQINLIYRLII